MEINEAINRVNEVIHVEEMNAMDEVKALPIDDETKNRIVQKIDCLFGDRCNWMHKYEIEELEHNELKRTCAYLASLLYRKSEQFDGISERIVRIKEENRSLRRKLYKE